MENNLFNPETINGSGFYWWTGIIVSDESWKVNQVAEKWSDVDTLPGWGARYKVRIVGKHTKVKSRLSDNDLELCDVIYPVTAGSGHGASYQTSNLKQGSVVVGFYKDGIDGNEPIIFGCIGNNEQTYLKRTQENGFDPLSGLDSVPFYSIVPGGSGPRTGPNGSKTIESNTLTTPTRRNLSDQKKSEGETIATPIPTTSICEPIELTGVARIIRNLIQDIEKAKKEINDWKYKLTNELISENGQKFGLQEYIQYKVQNGAKSIVGWFKNLVFEIKRRVNGNLERGAKDLYYLIFPNEREKANKVIKTARDLINCLFRKIIGQLISMLTKFLISAVDRFINVPLCAAENILAAIIGKLTGLINSALNAIMAPIYAIFGAVDLIGDVLQIVKDILTFFSCDDPPNCSKVKEWSIYDGPGGGFDLDLNSFFNKVKTFASNVQQSVNPDNFNFDLDFSDVFDNPCNVDAILCGPPTVEFFGGGGSGAAGNAIVSAAGEILGVDITLPGSNYTSAPFVKFVDACGKGRGAVGMAILGPVDKSQNDDGIINIDDGTNKTIGVIGVLIENNGSGYIPSPDGDLGGDGRIWSKKDQTTIKRKDGTYDRPYNPGEIINVFPGDLIRLPTNTTSQVGNKIISGGQYQLIDTEETVTAPAQVLDTITRNDYPGLGDGKYPVILYLCGLEIQNSGFDYSKTDQIVIEPSNGAVAVPKFGSFGTLEGIKIISFGEGFKEVPKIYIKSETGFNAKLIPKFCIDRVSTDQLKEPGIQDKVISVIDCVGKVPQVDFFRVPR